ncbi:hypothetical protein ACNFJ7_16705 [Sphingomonas sp. HT-1]|uniref:hypothetical protein n=1 Tax=unclassified Sphingomonas TaxID=196159 RepID=UPI000A7B5A0E|nr:MULTISPECIES: hypothetical protein [unclassified Sphingomonas]
MLQGFALGDGKVLAEAAVKGSTGTRRISVGNCRKLQLATAMRIGFPETGQVRFPPAPASAATCAGCYVPHMCRSSASGGRSLTLFDAAFAHEATHFMGSPCRYKAKRFTRLNFLNFGIPSAARRDTRRNARTPKLPKL